MLKRVPVPLSAVSSVTAVVALGLSALSSSMKGGLEGLGAGLAGLTAGVGTKAGAWALRGFLGEGERAPSGGKSPIRRGAGLATALGFGFGVFFASARGLDLAIAFVGGWAFLAGVWVWAWAWACGGLGTVVGGCGCGCGCGSGCGSTLIDLGKGMPRRSSMGRSGSGGDLAGLGLLAGSWLLIG